MRLALMIPCYIDQLKPEVGISTLRILEACGHEVVFPEAQTCCGQPFLTAGEVDRAKPLGAHYVEVFESFDRIITPSGSCAATIRHHLPRWVAGSGAEQTAGRTMELCEFLASDEGGSAALPAGRFAHRVGLHASCHALRELGQGTPSETRNAPLTDPAALLLSKIEGLELVDLVRRDECCGFGGVFAVAEEAVSCRMGLDRLADHQGARAEIVASTDASCLMHLEGLSTKRGMPLRMMHVAEIIEAACLPNEVLDGAR
ncbi:MAG: (Fe-S)-binding protein [Myxococcota bacterium]